MSEEPEREDDDDVRWDDPSEDEDDEAVDDPSEEDDEGPGDSDEAVWEEDETDAAAKEAGAIGGVAGDEDMDPAQRPLAEAGEGQAEGFELAEDELIDHATHGDQQSAHVVLRDQGADEDPLAAEQTDAEGDAELSSEEENQD
jgi:hypothetical protein